MTSEEFINKAQNVHGNKYEYSKVEYVNNKTKVCIICPEHGEFWQTPHAHLQGQGCSKCSGRYVYDCNGFIDRATRVHGDKYEYSKVAYVNNRSKICIICPEHGEFWQTPVNHLRGQGCPKCRGNAIWSKRERMTSEKLIRGFMHRHGDKYDYSKTMYIDTHTKVCIICPEHGEFWQLPYNHMQGQGCPVCRYISSGNAQSLSSKNFVDKARMIHCDKYNYFKVNYVNYRTSICIICPEHGEFWQTPNDHLKGAGCPKCGGVYHYNSEEWVIAAKRIHGNKYDYSKVDYSNNKTKVCIICSEHGEFWQKPDCHLRGQGCPRCNSSHMEDEISNFLTKHNILFDIQKKYEWLGTQSLDFYLPEYNIAIECQGIQHFNVVEHFGGYEGYKNRLELDQRKQQLCKENGIILLYYANYDYEFPYEVITDKEKLYIEICKYKKNAVY